jgi:cysteine desulfurase
MGEKPMYFDYNATTPVHPDALEAMLPYLNEQFGNPSSGHWFGRQAKDAVESARARVASLIGASADEIVFTSGGTESNNLAIRGAASGIQGRRHVVTSVIEHPAVEKPCSFLEKNGWRVSRVRVDGEGLVKSDEAAALIGSDTALVTIMHANNETGTIQPVERISGFAHERGAIVHTDAAQSVGKIPVRVDDLGVDLLSIAGHKLYAPKGIGALYVRKGTPLSPLLVGAGHERGLRPGTENVPYIVGLGKACEIAEADLSRELRRVRDIRDLLWKLLQKAVSGIKLNGHSERRLPNTLNVRFPGVRGTSVLERCPLLAASTGSACHEAGENPSGVITAMGIRPEEALGSVRLTLGRFTTEEEIRRAAAVLLAGFQHALEAERGPDGFNTRAAS